MRIYRPDLSGKIFKCKMIVILMHGELDLGKYCNLPLSMHCSSVFLFQVLEICSKVLESLVNDEYVIANKCGIHRSTLIDRLVQNYLEANRNFFQQVCHICRYFFGFLYHK